MGFIMLAAAFAGLFAYAVSLCIICKKNEAKLKLRCRLEKLAGSDGSKAVKPRSSGRKRSTYASAELKSGLFSGAGEKLSLAGLNLRAEEYVAIRIVAAVGVPIVVFAVGRNIFAALGTAVIGAVVPPFAVSIRIKRRTALFETQLMDAMIIISNCLRAGFTFQQAMESVVEGMREPLSNEFGKALREIKLGIPLDKALQDMVTRVKNDDLGLLVSAVLIQKQVGGNLSEIIDNIAGTIKERIGLRGRVRVLTSSGKTSGLVVGLMPVFLLVILMVINPTYAGIFFTTTAGAVMLVIAAVMEIAGFCVIRKIVNIKF